MYLGFAYPASFVFLQPLLANPPPLGYSFVVCSHPHPASKATAKRKLCFVLTLFSHPCAVVSTHIQTDRIITRACLFGMGGVSEVLRHSWPSPD